MSVESIKHTKLNKGEWAEFYVLLKLLGEGRLYAADNLLRKKMHSYLDIVRIIREEVVNMPLDYFVDSNECSVIIKCKDEVLIQLPMNEFLKAANDLFAGLQKEKGNSVPAPDSVCDFAKVIYVAKPKAPAVKSLKTQFGGKNDIFIEVRDGQTSVVSVMGFSIKSRFAQPPTLFNAGSSSQYLYKVVGCTDAHMEYFNNITDGENRGWAKCKTYLKLNNLNLEFTKTANTVYNDNLFLVRESMGKILAWCYKDRLIDSSGDFEVKETTERMIAANPLGVPHPEVYYEKTMKDFLMATFTGMTAAKVWDGKEQVSGGYIVVMEDGDVLCYHSADRESFRDYLYRNTFFEYVSTKKYAWGDIFKENGDYYLPLNASIRFTKHTR